MIINADLDKLAFSELILSFDVNSSSEKIEFRILKGCKVKDYKYRNAT
jgi:hypothetical protein